MQTQSLDKLTNKLYEGDESISLNTKPETEKHSLFRKYFGGAKRSLKSLAYTAIIGAASLGVLAGNAEAINPKYKIERISWPDPNHPLTEAHSINEDGEVVGLYGNFGRIAYYAGYFINKNGVPRKIELDEDNAFREHPNPPRPKINNFGDVLLGNVVYKRNNDKIVLNSEDISIDFKVGTDLNDNCDVVAYASDQGYLYTNGEKIGLGFWADRLAINNNKQIVGSDYYDGYFWEDGLITKIIDASGLYDIISLSDINNNGTFVGYFVGHYEPYFRGGCIWRNKGQEKIELGYYLWPYAINDNEQVVGEKMVEEKAFLSQNGKTVLLNQFLPEFSEWASLQVATDINNKGQIVGYGWLKYGDQRRRAFLMTPIPLEGDLNEDDIVNLKDLAELAEHWLEEK